MKNINIMNNSTAVVIIIISLSIVEDNIVQFVAHSFSFLEQSTTRSLLSNLMRRNSNLEKPRRWSRWLIFTCILAMKTRKTPSANWISMYTYIKHTESEFSGKYEESKFRNTTKARKRVTVKDTFSPLSAGIKNAKILIIPSNSNGTIKFHR